MRGGGATGRLDPELSYAVLAAAMATARRQRRHELPAGLTERNKPDDAVAWIAGWTG